MYNLFSASQKNSLPQMPRIYTNKKPLVKIRAIRGDKNYKVVLYNFSQLHLYLS